MALHDSGRIMSKDDVITMNGVPVHIAKYCPKGDEIVNPIGDYCGMCGEKVLTVVVEIKAVLSDEQETDIYLEDPERYPVKLAEVVR